MKKIKEAKGITLVALVITVIIMLILAGVTINMTLGERGIFTTAANTKEKQEIAEYLERIELSRVEVASKNMGKVTLDNLIDQIVEDKIVTRERITKIDVDGEEKAKMITKEGYNFIITADKAEYAGKGDVIPTPPTLQEGDIQVTLTPTTWTNDKVTVEIKTKVEGSYTIQYSLDEGTTWKDYTTTFDVSENKTICACLRNALGEKGNYTTFKVDKIDKQKPVVGTLTPTPTSIRITATDEASGIIGYVVTTNTTQPTTFTGVNNTKILDTTVTGKSQNTTYYVWVKDQAGNVSAYISTKTTTQAVTSISVTPASATLKPNETVQLSASVQPSNAYNKNYSWSTSNSNIATVSSTGLVTAKVAGSVTITATANDGSGKSGSATITVENNVLASKITAANYGDYVNYPVANGSTSKGHTTDWRIFYKDDDGYVYLISSYYLRGSETPRGTNLISSSERPFAAYWSSPPGSYTAIEQTTYDRYKMNYKYNGSPNNNLTNMYCVSQLMNTNVWSKFVNTTYAEDAIGAPTLEMWVESWNAKGNTKLYYNNTNSYGYYVGTSSTPTKTYVKDLTTTDTLYFPVTSSSCSDSKGYDYWLSSPSAASGGYLAYVGYFGYVGNEYYDNDFLSVRPLVRLKNTVVAEQGSDGVWNLK